MRVKVLLEYENQIFEGIGRISDDPSERNEESFDTFTSDLNDPDDCDALLDDIKKLYQQIKSKGVNPRR